MRKTRDGHKRQNQYDLEKLKVGKLTVLTFFLRRSLSEILIPSRRVINLENAGLIRFPVKKLRISDGIFVILLML